MKRKKSLALGFFLLLLALVWLSPALGAEAKNVILLIGDGMGPQALGLGIYYNLFLKGPEKPLYLQKLMAAGNTGYCLTHQYGTVVTDSASAATALASGVKTRDAMIGKDADGRPMKSILDIAREAGKSTGLISDTRITHATPAGFYGHVVHRNMENELAAQLISRGDLHVAFSGGAEHFVPLGTRVEEHKLLKGISQGAGWGASRRQDTRDLLQEARDKGYRVVANEEELAGLNAKEAPKVLGLFAASAFPAAIDRQPPANAGLPSLARMTAKALEILAANPKGFFLMVEGGQIDWAAHANDAGSLIHELLEFDQALGVAMALADTHPDTLLIVTADHDTGGLAIAYSGYDPPAPVLLASSETWKTKANFGDKKIFEKMARQKKSFQRMLMASKGDPASLKREVEANTACTLTDEQAAFVLARDPATGFPATKDYSEFYVYGAVNSTALLARLFGKEMNVAWAVGTHTHTPVPVFARGPLAEKFRGLLDNVEIPRIIAREWGGVLPAAK